jgi:DNA-binding HxlR family transcriptional regulator
MMNFFYPSSELLMTIDRVENQAGIFRIALSLTLGETKISDLIRIAGVTQKAAYRAIYQLAIMEWIEERQMKKFPFTRVFYLTEKGEKAAKVIKQLEKLTNSPIDDPKTYTTITDTKVETKTVQSEGWTLEKGKKL